MRKSHFVGLSLSFCLGLGGAVGTLGAGCGSSSRGSVIDDSQDGSSGSSGSSGFPTGFGDAGDAHACQGLQCQQQTCSGGGDTTVTGTVFAPNGTLPLYNAIVYVPNTTPDALTHGATCDQCGAVTGNPVVTALSNSDGTFTLSNVPVGANIPLVVQVGKWRRQVTISNVAACTETALTAEQTRLPKNQSEGDVPKIALTAGGCDNLGCMLPKIGLDPTEFGVAADGPSKSVHTYNGQGGQGPSAQGSATGFWNDPAQLKTYDLVLLSCECSEAQNTKSATSFAAMDEYLKAGGRIFTTDYMYTWYNQTKTIDPALYNATTIGGGAPVVSPSTMTIDTSFPKGKALGDWLGVVLPGSADQVSPTYLFHNVQSLNATEAQQWATSPTVAGPRAFSVNLPVGVPAAMQCGKAVHLDAHLNGGGSNDRVGPTYPASCGPKLTDGEKLLAFFFFDLASCIQNDNQTPKPPPVK